MNEETIYDQTPKAGKPQQKKAEKSNGMPTDKQQSANDGVKTEKMKVSPKGKKNNSWGAAGIAGAAGLAAGVLTPFLVFPKSSGEIDEAAGTVAPTTSGHHVGHDLEIATGVDDSMTFSEAFAAARQEVGAGGIFVWHGHTYGTYYANEWNAMSPDDRDQYWSDVSHTTTHINENLTENEPHEEVPVVEPIDDPVVVAGNGDIPSEPVGGWDGDGEPEPVPIATVDEQVELDINGDGTMDVAVVDVNANEVTDIMMDTTGDGQYDTVLMDVSIAGVNGVQPVEGEVASFGEGEDSPTMPDEEPVMEENPDVDVLASNDMDTIVPVDNNMDMGEFV